jgi:hypothetical protein
VFLEFSVFESANTHELHTQNIVFEIPNFGTFSGINVNTVRSWTYKVGENYIIADVSMKGTRKEIEVRSEFIMINNSGLDLNVMFNKPGERYVMACPINEQIPVPIECCHHELGILPMNEVDIDGWSSINLMEFCSKRNGDCVEICSGQIYFLV